MKKKLLAVFLVLTLVLSFSSASFVYAQTTSDVQNKLDNVEKEQNQTSERLAQVEKDIKSLQAKVNNLNEKIKTTTEEIASIEKEIEKKEKEMQEREDNLNQRLRVMYKNGSVGFIDVLLGSNSISEFVSNRCV